MASAPCGMPAQDEEENHVHCASRGSRPEHGRRALGQVAVERRRGDTSSGDHWPRAGMISCWNEYNLLRDDFTTRLLCARVGV